MKTDGLSLFRGELIRDDALGEALLRLPSLVANDLTREPPSAEVVIDALGRLQHEISVDEAKAALREAGMGASAGPLPSAALDAISPQTLRAKMDNEIGGLEAYRPLGVLGHVAAGNTPGVAALSAVEGLLTGNINIIKLPGNDAGFTARLLHKLTCIEPQLIPYIYALNVSSSDADRIGFIVRQCDAVAVWGGDEAVAAIRRIAPTKTQLIEWGSRISVAYVARDAVSDGVLDAIAYDVCSTDQLFCSSPQCLLVEAQGRDELIAVANKFAEAMGRVSPTLAPCRRSLDDAADVSLTVQLARAMQAVGRQFAISDANAEWHVIADIESSALRASPLFRTVWVLAVSEEALPAILHPHRGRLQTVGIAAQPGDLPRLTNLFLRAGATRITPVGGMSHGTSADPRDGQSPLRRYVRRVQWAY